MEKMDLKSKLHEVSERIRTMREIMNLTEEEMADKTGVSLEDYRAYESGEKDFSFTFIYKCANRFGIDSTDLIKGESPTLSSFTVTRKGEGLPITRRQGFTYLNKAPLFKNKTAEPFYVKIPYSDADNNAPIKLSIQITLLCAMLFFVGEIRTHFDMPASRLYRAVQTWTVSAGMLTSLAVALAFFLKKTDRFDYFSLSITLIGLTATAFLRWLPRALEDEQTDTDNNYI